MAEGAGAQEEQAQTDKDKIGKACFQDWYSVPTANRNCTSAPPKSLKRNQEFFRCANYKDGRGSCTIHFIRDVVLEMIVKEAVAGLADFVRCYESVFLYAEAEMRGVSEKRQQELKLSMEGSRKRIADLDKLFSRIYEDNVIGKLSDERYARMAAEYESEQKELLEKVKEEEKQLSEMEQKSVDMRLLLQGLRGVYRHERAYADDRQQADPAH